MSETTPTPEIEFSDFQKVNMRVGTILSVEPNPKANKPAYVISVDFGAYGIKTSSAQLTVNYQAQDLIGKQIVAVVNFPTKRIAGIKSEILILGALCPENDVVLLHPTKPVQNGSPIG
jgi:tRNA-binding protein